MASAKPKKKIAQKNDVEGLTMSPTERILKNISELYERGLGGSGESWGLKAVAEDPLIGVTCHKPRKRVSCMIIGNHSAGKSSFLNWYIGETIQKTGVAIETRGFSFLTSGRKREELKGDATLAYFDHLSEISQFEGINANLFTEVSTSKEKNFSCVDFIDSPGLVDGDMQYPFDVASCIVWMADYVDIILCFFDPIGQALCKRTVDVIKRLNVNHAEKMQYYMSKADQVETELDRQRVLIQITQNLHPHIKNSHAFNLPTIFLPNESNQNLGIPNALEEVCEDIDKAIRMTVQKNLTALKEDCDRLIARMDERIAEDKATKKTNSKNRNYGLLLTLVSWGVLSTIAFVIFCAFYQQPFIQAGMSKLQSIAPEPAAQVAATAVMFQIQDSITLQYVLAVLISFYLVLFITTKIIWKALPTLTKKEQQKIIDYKKYVKGMHKIRDDLYKEYFKQLNNDL